ncbi:MAG: hypothetical protein SFV54_27795 [Bryobacteraceae bacterium]|nr:hypothetical protein [Bryobacteraceae bacterium]
MKHILLLLCLPVGMLGGERIDYWIEACRPATSGCAKSDIELAEWALDAWARASDGALEWQRTTSAADALLQFHWAPPKERYHGEARPFLAGNRQGSRVYIRADLSGFPGSVGERSRLDPLYRDSVIYLTCLHEIGHALGMNHALLPGPIMYNGDRLTRVFADFRAGLRVRSDIRRSSAISAYDRNRLKSLLWSRRVTAR